MLFTFAGSSHQNYANYLLEFICNFEYEIPPPLKDVLFSSYLVNLSGLPGHFIERDLMQEHCNHLLQEMVDKASAFEDKHVRDTISLNIHALLSIKENLESGVGLKRRSSHHKAPHLRAEYDTLLRKYRTQELHSFRSGRRYDHLPINSFAAGYRKLDGGKLDDFLKRSLIDMELVSGSTPADKSVADENVIVDEEDGEDDGDDDLFR
jgi:hypothetical protein